MNPVEQLHQIADRVWKRRLERETYLQIRAGHVESIMSPSLAEAEADVRFGAALAAELTQINAAALPHEAWLTYAFLENYAQQLGSQVKLWWAHFPVTPYQSSWLSMFGGLIFPAFRFETTADADRYLKLIQDYARAVQGMLDRVRAQAENGWRVPRPALAGVHTSLSRLKASAAYLMRVPAERLALLDAATSTRLQQSVDTLLEGDLANAFDALIAYLDEDYRQTAPEVVGITQYPGGAEAYETLIRFNVTFSLSPNRIHAVGLEQVQMLTEAMAQVRAGLGFAGGETEFIATLKANGRLHADSAAQVEATYHHHLRRIEPLMPDWFAVAVPAPYEVRRLAPALEAGMSFGYYEPPSAQQPVGLYHYNGSGLETRSQLNAATLIYHELIPGHHYHLSRQQNNASLPPIRREAIEYGGYNEGWAEYAAGLPQEMGLYDDPYDLYGRLIHERFTAQRLVIDTGMNAFGWSLERARAYMKANTLESDEQIGTETLRYSTDLPAQALAYRLGYLKFHELRTLAQNALG
ncbi:MAG: DUF885 domain-containing protein, partial [Anaerolinea sp.]|nr:DUF885 domain-containing protein [Anaerolinea sp.]